MSPFSIADLALNWTEGYADVLRKRLVADYHSVKLTAA
ncbi:hypothetical protein APY03_0742 [Variovorax sp. WDL1]|nr:hypothetical protein APY03_0742 [Variovorax sp. WDL1]